MAEKKRYSKRYCRYTESKIEFIDYKDIDKNLLMKKIEDTIESNQKTI